ncbi:unnamed protein product, partial [Mesorhabditis belari]|uniref:poly(ADP-ribose) glycohydrolase n=1 Tax=Mesorhabditis belari TaxID=2138241 RepID=A0AAF3FHZ1_9BILA
MFERLRFGKYNEALEVIILGSMLTRMDDNPELGLTLDVIGETEMKKKANRGANPILTTKNSSNNLLPRKFKDGSVVEKIPNFKQKNCPIDVTPATATISNNDVYEFEGSCHRNDAKVDKKAERPKNAKKEKKEKTKPAIELNDKKVPVAEETNEAHQTNKDEAEALGKVIEKRRRQSIEGYITRERPPQAKVQKTKNEQEARKNLEEFQQQSQRALSHKMNAEFGESCDIVTKRVRPPIHKEDEHNDENMEINEESDNVLSAAKCNLSARSADPEEITIEDDDVSMSDLHAPMNCTPKTTKTIDDKTPKTFQRLSINKENEVDLTPTRRMDTSRNVPEEPEILPASVDMECDKNESLVKQESSQSSELNDLFDDLVETPKKFNSDVANSSLVSKNLFQDEDDRAKIKEPTDDAKSKWKDGRLILTCLNPDEWAPWKGTELLNAQNVHRISNLEKVLKEFKASWSVIGLETGRDYLACFPGKKPEPILEHESIGRRSIVLPHNDEKWPISDYRKNLSLRRFYEFFFESKLSQDDTEKEFSEIRFLFTTFHGNEMQLRGLEKFWEKCGWRYSKTFQYICRLVSEMEDMLPKELPLLYADIQSMTFTLKQCTTLLAMAFLGFFRPLKREECPRFDFFAIFASTSPLAQQKLHFIFNYFKECLRCETENNGDRDHCITFYRRRLREADFVNWTQSDTLLWNSNMVLTKTTPIEDYYNATHLDFANKYIGGGVLTEGAVQEEIRLLCCPDALVALLFSPRMNDQESIHIIGAPTISGYKGYSQTLEFVPLQNKDRRVYRDVDKFNRCNTEILAIDALDLYSKHQSYQYSGKGIDRELNKAFTGFYNEDNTKRGRPLATGKWGCGAFGGDPFLKALIQWMAAAECNRDLVFVVMDDSRLVDTLDAYIVMFKKFNMTVGALYKLLLTYQWKPPNSLAHVSLEQYIIDQMHDSYDGDLLKA